MGFVHGSVTHRPGAIVGADPGYGAPGTGDRRSGGGAKRADATAEAEQGHGHGRFGEDLRVTSITKALRACFTNSILWYNFYN